MPVDLRQLGTPIETKDGAQSKADAAEDSANNYTDSEVDSHESSTSGVHGVGASDVESESGAQSKVDDHATENVGVHGAGSSGLASSDDVESQVDNHADETEGIHGAPASVALVHEGTPVENLTTELTEGQSLAIDSDGNIVSREADTDVYTPADEEERLELDQATQGDFAIEQDTDTTYILSGDDPSDDDNWSEIKFNRYTDGEAVEAVDAEVTESAASVSGLDTEVSGKADAADVSDIQASSDVVHDDTDGGTEGNPHAESAHTSDVSDIQASSDVVHDDTDGGTDSDAHHARYTDSEASAAAPVQSVDSETGDVTLDYADENHSQRHENDGPDELDAGELSGASGNDGEVLATDGVAAYWKVIESGTSVDDFVRESGDFRQQLWDGGDFTQTIDLSNTFATGMATAGGYESDSSDEQIFFAVAVTGYNTDGDGNITGIVIEGSGYMDSSSDDITVGWQMFGVEA